MQNEAFFVINIIPSFISVESAAPSCPAAAASNFDWEEDGSTIASVPAAAAATPAEGIMAEQHHKTTTNDTMMGVLIVQEPNFLLFKIKDIAELLVITVRIY